MPLYFLFYSFFFLLYLLLLLIHLVCVHRRFVRDRRGDYGRINVCRCKLMMYRKWCGARKCMHCIELWECGIPFSFVVFTFSMLSLCSRIAIQFSFVRSVSLSSLHFIYFVKDAVLFPINMKEKNMFWYWRRPNPSCLPLPLHEHRERMILDETVRTEYAQSPTISIVYSAIRSGRRMLLNTFNSEYWLTPHK